MTLLETLLSVAILSMLAVAIASWTRVVADAEATTRPRLARAISMEAALRLIEDDLRCGDLASGRVAPRGTRRPRASVDGMGRLLIETRDGGSVLHAYSFEESTRTLRVASNEESPRLLVERIDSWEARVDAKSDLLEVSWSSGDRTSSRRWLLR